MENKKLESQKISDKNAENVAGGTRVHVDATIPLVSKIDAIYLNKEDYSRLKKAGAIDKNDELLSIDKLSDLDDTELSDSKLQLTTGKPKTGEIKVKMSHPFFDPSSSPFEKK